MTTFSNGFEEGLNGSEPHRPHPNGADDATASRADNHGHPRLQSAAAFLASFRPVESIVDGLPIPRGGVTALTGPTGHGKTTIATLLQTCIVNGRPFAGRETTAGGVLALVGENPDDYAMHLAATLQDTDADPNDRLLIVPGTFDLIYELDYLHERVAATVGDLAAVFVDTSAAFNMGDDENGNVEMRRHASALRELTTLPGRPAVIVLAHPVKNATRENLTPRGGGAFLAEIDVNLTAWQDASGLITLHWCGKVRGRPPEPVQFELIDVPLRGLVDSRGRPIHSTAARHVDDARAGQMLARACSDEDVLLKTMQRNPNSSVRDLAMKAGWVSSTMKPLVSRVDRRLKDLQARHLVEQDRKGQWRLTRNGQKEADALL